MKGRRTAVAAVLVVCLAAAAVYVAQALRSGPAASTVVAPSAAALAALTREPYVVFRNTRLGAGYGQLAVVPLRNPGANREFTSLECERVDIAAGTGVCLTADRGVFTTYSAAIFDASFTVTHTMPLSGIPSRVRVAPDGRLAAITVFVTGHSYAQAGFSTLTTIVDTTTRQVLADLESFDVYRDGTLLRKPDFNFWGVTFGNDSKFFYATLGSGEARYLIRGDVAKREATVLRSDVECPSLSPDGQHLAFKKRLLVDGRVSWRLAILDLSNDRESEVSSESRNLDDQVEWLDSDQIIYSMSDPATPGSMTTFVVRRDGEQVRTFIEGAYSASVGQP